MTDMGVMLLLAIVTTLTCLCGSIASAVWKTYPRDRGLEF